MHYRNQDELNKAFEVLDKAQQFAESSLYEKGIIDSYHRFALLNLLRGDQENAEFYKARADKMLESYRSYPFGEGFSKYVEAKLLYSSDLNFRALKGLEDAKKLSNDRNLLNNMVLLEGMIYMRIQDYEKAAVSFNSLLVNTDDIEKDFLITKANLGLADLYIKTGNYAESIRNGLNALKLSKDNNFVTELIQANEYLALAYELDEQYKLALNYKENIVKVKDSLFNIDKIKVKTNKATIMF